ncbi:MAG: hypothetical protein K1V72_00995 [Duncaniella sp.]|jgi:hypothetical protein
MKKIFTLFAAAVMALSASAEVVKVELNADKETSAISAANTVLFENEDLKVTNAYAGMGRTNNAYNYFDNQEDRAISFDGCVNVRGKKPTEDNVIGEIDRDDHSPLILEVKKAMTISGYVRTGDNKKLSLYCQSPFSEIASNPAGGENDSRTGSDTRWCFTWNITPGTYTLTEISGGGRFSGFTYEVTGSSAITDINVDNANAPVEYFNLQGIRVENPANGLYIRRQGNKVEKVYVK